MMLLMSGRVNCERLSRGPGSSKQVAIAHAGSIIGAATLLCSTGSRELYTAATTCHVLAICMHELQNILKRSQSAYLDILFAGSKALAYYIRRFVSLGLNRVWLRAGDVAYKQGEKAESMYVVISGRLRLVSQRKGAKGQLHVDEEVGRGETIGAVWAVTGGMHDTSAVAVRGCELVRLSRGSFEVGPLARLCI
jgi:CRP-like cAMP-binding protein